MTSGSGTGNDVGSTTGTGGNSSTGAASTITGSGRGIRQGSTGFGTGAFGPDGRARGGNPNYRSRVIGANPAARFPDDASLVPLEALEGSAPGNPSELSSVPPNLLREARKIPDPAERSLTLTRLANAAIFSAELNEAHHALTEAGNAALLVEDRLVHDQRLISAIVALLTLAEADLREGKGDTLIPEIAEALPPTTKIDRNALIRRADLEWQRAFYLAVRIHNITFRNEYIFRVVDAESFGTQTISKDYPTTGSRTGFNEPKEPYHEIAEKLIRRAADEAQECDRPVWRDRALVETAVNAAGGRLYTVALEVARRIPQPEVRTDALVRIAEIQATKSDHPEAATATYQEAARAVASIPLDDPRAVLAGVLIDNLISVGRFEDARRSVILYPDTARRMTALGAVAYSQGRRNGSSEARKWIAKEVPEEHRGILYRRVTEGIIDAIEQNRSRALDRNR
jgi:hypothetical protein